MRHDDGVGVPQFGVCARKAGEVDSGAPHIVVGHDERLRMRKVRRAELVDRSNHARPQLLAHGLYVRGDDLGCSRHDEIVQLINDLFRRSRDGARTIYS